MMPWSVQEVHGRKRKRALLRPVCSAAPTASPLLGGWREASQNSGSVISAAKHLPQDSINARFSNAVEKTLLLTPALPAQNAGWVPSTETTSSESDPEASRLSSSKYWLLRLFVPSAADLSRRENLSLPQMQIQRGLNSESRSRPFGVICSLVGAS